MQKCQKQCLEHAIMLSYLPVFFISEPARTDPAGKTQDEAGDLCAVLVPELLYMSPQFTP